MYYQPTLGNSMCDKSKPSLQINGTRYYVIKTKFQIENFFLLE